MSVRDHLSLKDIQDLLDAAYASMGADIPIERKKAIEDQISIMPLNEATYIMQLIEVKLTKRIRYLEIMKENKIQDMSRN